MAALNESVAAPLLLPPQCRQQWPGLPTLSNTPEHDQSFSSPRRRDGRSTPRSLASRHCIRPSLQPVWPTAQRREASSRDKPVDRIERRARGHVDVTAFVRRVGGTPWSVYSATGLVSPYQEMGSRLTASHRRLPDAATAICSHDRPDKATKEIAAATCRTSSGSGSALVRMRSRAPRTTRRLSPSQR